MACCGAMTSTFHRVANLQQVRATGLGLLLAVLSASNSWGQALATNSTGSASDTSTSDVVELPEFILTESRVANDLPASTYAAPVSSLRFEPRVDVQTRNFAEAQGDVSIRGGIFEGTAVQVAGLTIFDPQTGHYATELPIAPEMLGAPRILTGLDHAYVGMNATAGTISYGWREIRDGGSLQAGWGNDGLYRASLRAAKVLQARDQTGGPRMSAEAEVAYSTADGTIANGDHEFFRASARVAIDSNAGQTTLFAGYQSKFFGWPNLYTPFGVAETEDIQTTLVMVSHVRQAGEVVWEAAAHYRRNRDDYEYDRFRPGIFNPYEHVTEVTGAFLRLHAPLGDWNFDARGEANADSITSTSLGNHGRTSWKLGAVASRVWDAGDRGAAGGTWETRFGLTYDETNREASDVAPMVEIAWSPRSRSGPGPRWYAQYSETSRVPGYTALYSSPTGGLFRGNPNLGREQSRNLEAGVQIRHGAWNLHAAVFQRRDDPLVDWTFTTGTPNARTARAVQVDNTGIEIVGSHTWGAVDLVAGYTWLEKDADYGPVAVDASFYALNFPRHRFTLALIARLGGGFELRSDNEYRVQEPNRLRTVGGDNALLSSVGLYWRSPELEGLELSLIVDNLWASDFQELPAVPAAGRQVTFGAAWRW